ncbi:hypothetical protein [Mesorhizobium sp. SP-1A]|uniref:hypothetical protein n=1 Tax=Mesorhizobium sp. SP-1A TaxID=3077840 RepID=UPI0028F700B8|nr:hypothetical protein [Mesorhizobium sp. SP-1A]
MTQNASENILDAALVVIGKDATVCILDLPERLRGTKFENVGFDDDGFFLTSTDGDRYGVKDGMSAEDYEQSCSTGPFMLREFVGGEIQAEEYQVDALPRTLGMSFGA